MERNALLSAVQLAEQMEACYRQRVELFGFDAGTDFYVSMLRKAMDRHRLPVLEAALKMIALSSASADGEPRDGAAMATHGFCAAAYWLVEVEPNATEEE